MKGALSTSATSRPGFALLTVLWVLVGASLLALQVVRTSRDAIGTANNRIGARRAMWAAEGCVAESRAMIDALLRDSRDADRAWLQLDSALAAVAETGSCERTLTPAGLALDVNTATPEQLRTLFRGVGMEGDPSDSLTAAIIDWRDPDDDTQPDGAEREWYHARLRATPRNSAFTTREELRLVRGWTPQLDSLRLLDVDDGPVLLGRAPEPVLAALGRHPGAENARAPVEGLTRERGVTATPAAWTIRATGTDGVSGVRSTVAVRIVHSGSRAAVVRHSTEPWT
jgi:type II secretory pathway component PulK